MTDLKHLLLATARAAIAATPALAMPFDIPGGDLKTALDAYAKAKGEKPEDCDMVDLLTDMMHLCDEQGEPFAGRLTTAQMHYAAETEDADDDES